MKLTLREAIRQNEARPPEARLEDAALAEVLGRRVASVHEAKSRMRARGELRPSERQVTGAALPLPNGGPRPALPLGGNPVDLLDVLQNGDVLTASERLRLASHLARTAASPVALNALRVLATDLDPNPPHTIGPPAPLTQSERVQRLGALILACGPETTELALLWAEHQREADSRIGPPSPPPRDAN